MLSVKTIASIALLLLKMANGLFAYLREKRFEGIGEDRATAKALLALAASDRALKEVDERIDAMNDDEVRAELAASGDFRD